MATTETALPGFRTDLWEPELTRRGGAHQLTSIEVTVTNRCNMRCRHCAVGETLVMADAPRIPLDLLLRRLDEVPGLRTLSITGGEPSENLGTLTEYVLPLLRYAKVRGLHTQVNTNLTFDLARYELLAPLTDVLHISWNYVSVADFHRIAWGHGREQVSPTGSEKLFTRIIENARALASAGCFLSAESMVNRETAPHLAAMNRFIAELGCRRHEVHPMYPADWAVELTGLMLTLDEFRVAADRFLDERDPDLWLLLGTFPFLPCSPRPEDRALLRKVRQTPHVTVRNCPDGRNRLNVNAFTGEVFVTDFASLPPLGNLHADSLTVAFDRWQQHAGFAPYNCYCAEAGCTGPNLVVAAMYHPGVDFRERKALP
ncbi:MAG TPA: radical SAM/CxCxxxxC motif protein YfkAB [Symbiobacteriaceae bacterium]